jgi:hypothetical protein
MAPEQRKRLLLAALVAALALFAVYQFWPRTASAPARASNVRGQGRQAASQGAVTAPDVHLEALNADRPRPDEATRNLFRFRATAPPPSAPRPGPQAARPVQPTPVPGPPPSSVPAINVKFVGFITERETGDKIASLSLNDGRGVVLGKEGQTVLGRYKIWQIGEESIEVSYLDGTGRTTIRLTGQ